MPLIDQFFIVDKQPDTIIGCYSETIASCGEDNFSSPLDGELVRGDQAIGIRTLDPPVRFQKTCRVIDDHRGLPAQVCPIEIFPPPVIGRYSGKTLILFPLKFE